MANAPGWGKLIEGLYLEAATEPHLHILGDFFYAVLLIQAMIAIYMKTEDFGTTLMVAFIISSGAVVLLPVQTQGLLFLAVLLGISGILYKIFV